MPAIEVRGLGKQFRVGAAKQVDNSSTLQEMLAEGFANTFRRDRRADTATRRNYFWALKDLDLDISEGQVIGIVGRNGSGKSTLLKILSDILEPTEGRAVIRGRVASLLEVGTGFHGQLTGRENIYLNGALLGMKQHEVQRNFDRIVEFAGVGKFLDTMVKRYSSGMYVRLAFAVAAYLEPEVLIVDEVLAVGDYEFQQKCLGRMEEVARTGRTVLFVSHNMAAVEALCTRCVLFDGGRLVDDGEPYEITRKYRQQMTMVRGNAQASLSQVEGSSRKQKVFQSACMVDEAGELATVIAVSRPFEVRLNVRIPAGLRSMVFAVRVDSPFGARMFTLLSPPSQDLYQEGEQEVVCRVNEMPLAPGPYRIGLAVSTNREILDMISDVFEFIVVDGEIYKEGRGAPSGMCVARSEWGIGGRRMILDRSLSVDPAFADAALIGAGDGV